MTVTQGIKLTLIPLTVYSSVAQQSYLIYVVEEFHKLDIYHSFGQIQSRDRIMQSSRDE